MKKKKTKLAFEELERELDVISFNALTDFLGGSSSSGTGNGYWSYINGKWEFTYSGGLLEEVVVTPGSGNNQSNWYGNYLGPHNNVNGLPIDRLDYAAFLHDTAYDRVGAQGISSALGDYNTIGADALLALMAIDIVTSSHNESIKARSWALLTSAAFTTITIGKAPGAAYDAFWRYVFEDLLSSGSSGY